MATQNKTPAEYLALYAEGWTKGDVDTILAATAPGYTFDDPQESEPVSREQFGAYFETLKVDIRLNQGNPAPESFMLLSEVMVQERPSGLVAWCWWEIPELVEGAGLIHVGPQGVTSEKIAYYQ